MKNLRLNRGELDALIELLALLAAGEKINIRLTEATTLARITSAVNKLQAQLTALD